MSLAKTKEEFLELLSKDLLPVKNLEMAKQKITENFNNKLSEEEISIFLDSCKFVDNGIAHFDYEVIAKKLTYVELYEFMNLFGIDGKLFDQVKDARCDGNHNCVWTTFSTCMPSC